MSNSPLKTTNRQKAVISPKYSNTCAYRKKGFLIWNILFQDYHIAGLKYKAKHRGMVVSSVSEKSLCMGSRKAASWEYYDYTFFFFFFFFPIITAVSSYQKTFLMTHLYQLLQKGRAIFVNVVVIVVVVGSSYCCCTWCNKVSMGSWCYVNQAPPCKNTNWTSCADPNNLGCQFWSTIFLL